MLTVVGLNDHAIERIACLTVPKARDIDVADLGFFTFDDHMLFEVLPRHRDGSALDVFVWPRVHVGLKLSTASLSSPKALGCNVLGVFTLPGVAHRVIFIGFCILLDLSVGHVGEEIQIPLTTRPINFDAFVGFVSNRKRRVDRESRTDTHRGNGASVQDGAKVCRVTKAPVRECAVLRVIKCEAHAPRSFGWAGGARFQVLPTKTRLGSTRITTRNKTRACREVRRLLSVLLNSARAICSAETTFVLRGNGSMVIGHQARDNPERSNSKCYSRQAGNTRAC